MSIALSCAVILALLFGYMIAFIAKDPNGNDYVDTSIIADAAPITFLWVYTFPLGVYGPAIIPLLIAYLVTTVETVGDLSAVFEVSELDVNSPEFATSLQGGLTSDAICSILSCLMTTYVAICLAYIHEHFKACNSQLLVALATVCQIRPFRKTMVSFR